MSHSTHSGFRGMWRLLIGDALKKPYVRASAKIFNLTLAPHTTSVSCPVPRAEWITAHVAKDHFAFFGVLPAGPVSLFSEADCGHVFSEVNTFFGAVDLIGTSFTENRATDGTLCFTQRCDRSEVEATIAFTATVTCHES